MFVFFPLLLLKLQGTNRYFQRIAAEVGLDVSFADCTKPEKLKSALKPNTKVGQARFKKNWQLRIEHDMTWQFALYVCRWPGPSREVAG